ncbi:hypothetical protein D3C86_1943090 [compost metagenome]
MAPLLYNEIISVRKNRLDKVAFAADLSHRPVYIDLCYLLGQSLKTWNLLTQPLTQLAEQSELQVHHLLFSFQN